MNRPGTPLSVASEKRTFKPGVIMAARGIIATVPRKFPLGGTLSHSNWTSNNRARVSDADLDERPFLDGRSHDPGNVGGRRVQVGDAPTARPRGGRRIRGPEGAGAGTRR